MKAIYTVGEAAKLLGLGQSLVSRLFDRGDLQGYRDGIGRRRIARRSMLAYLRRHGMPPPLIPGDLVCDVRLIGFSPQWAADLLAALPDDFRVGDADRPNVVVIDMRQTTAAVAVLKSWVAIGAAAVAVWPEDYRDDSIRHWCHASLQQPVTASAVAATLLELLP